MRFYKHTLLYTVRYRKIPKVSPGLTFDIGANLVGLLSGGLTIGWAYFQEDFQFLIGRLTFQDLPKIPSLL